MVGYDGPTVYTPTEHFTAYGIAYDLRRTPVFVRPEHIDATLPVGATTITQDLIP